MKAKRKDKRKEISDAFGGAVCGVNLRGTSEFYSRDFTVAKIVGWKVRKEGKGYVVKITKLETPEGLIDKSRLDLCPHKYLMAVTGLQALDPSIRDFRRRWNVRRIESPHFGCDRSVHLVDQSYKMSRWGM